MQRKTGASKRKLAEEDLEAPGHSPKRYQRDNSPEEITSSASTNQSFEFSSTASSSAALSSFSSFSSFNPDINMGDDFGEEEWKAFFSDASPKSVPDLRNEASGSIETTAIEADALFFGDYWDLYNSYETTPGPNLGNETPGSTDEITEVQLLKTARDVFNINAFLPKVTSLCSFHPLALKHMHLFNLSQQFEVMQAIMHGSDVFVTLPTAAGKSLCFQVSSLSRLF